MKRFALGGAALVVAVTAMFVPAITAGATDDATPNPTTTSTIVVIETAAEPTEVPATCDAPGSWVAPSQEGVTWNTEVAGNVTVFDAVANEGYELGYDFQSHIEKLNAAQLTEGCVTIVVIETAAEPTEVPATCDAPGSWVAPSQEGVTWNTEVAGNVTVFDAVANEGYELGYDFQSHIEKLNAAQLTEGCVIDGGTSPGDKDDDGEAPGQGDTTGGGGTNTPTGGHAPGGTTPKPTGSAVVVTGTVVLGTD